MRCVGIVILILANIVVGTTGNEAAVAPLRNVAVKSQPANVARHSSRGPGSDLIWVGDASHLTPTVAGFLIGQSGNVKATQAITGSNTLLNEPIGIYKSAGMLYVANAGSPSITVYPVSSNGNVSPGGIISGSATELNSPAGVCVTLAGDIAVVNANSVTTYASGRFGNVSPIRKIAGSKTGLTVNDGGIAAQADLLFVSNKDTQSVLVFDVLGRGNISPIRVIRGSNTEISDPSGLTFDKAGDLYVANANNNAITEYAAGADGNAAPIAVLQGPNTLLSVPFDLVFDSQMTRLFVSNHGGGPALTAYGAPFNGNQSPLMTITDFPTLQDVTGVAF